MLQPALAATRVFSCSLSWLWSLPVHKRQLLISTLLLRNIAPLHRWYLACRCHFPSLSLLLLDTAMLYFISLLFTPHRELRGCESLLAYCPTTRWFDQVSRATVFCDQDTAVLARHCQGAARASCSLRVKRRVKQDKAASMEGALLAKTHPSAPRKGEQGRPRASSQDRSRLHIFRQVHAGINQLGLIKLGSQSSGQDQVL